MNFSSESVLEKVIQGLREIFPEIDHSTLTAKTTLGEMPEWDSMAAVNLQSYLLKQIEIEFPLELLSEETALQDIVDYLKNPIPSEIAE